MKRLRLAGLLGVAALTLLSGCVVAPIGPQRVFAYPTQPVYVEPAPVVVVPAPSYYVNPGWGYRGYWGDRGHRGYRGYRNWR